MRRGATVGVKGSLNVLTLVGAKESEEVVVKRVGRRLDRFLAEWERRVRDESPQAGLEPQFAEAGTGTFNLEETVPRAPMPPLSAELRQTQQIPISPAFAEQLGEASRLAQAEQALVRVNVSARSAAAVPLDLEAVLVQPGTVPSVREESSFGGSSDLTQIKTPFVQPESLKPAPPPAQPLKPAAPPPPPPAKSAPKSAPKASTPALPEKTEKESHSIPQASEASFSEMPASQIFAHGPSPRGAERDGGVFSLRVFSVVLQPAFLVSLLLTGAVLLFAYAMLGGEEFLP